MIEVKTKWKLKNQVAHGRYPVCLGIVIYAESVGLRQSEATITPLYSEKCDWKLEYDKVMVKIYGDSFTTLLSNADKVIQNIDKYGNGHLDLREVDNV